MTRISTVVSVKSVVHDSGPRWVVAWPMMHERNSKYALQHVDLLTYSADASSAV